MNAHGILALLPCLMFPLLAEAGTSDAQIHKTLQGKTPHYLVALTLTRENTLFPGVETGAASSPGASFTLRDGGQFEIRILKSALPVTAPECKESVIIRMPWTDVETPDGKTAIGVKEALFHRLDELRQGQVSSVPVTLDLSPYAKDVMGGPSPGVRLTACNVFFRNVGGRYVDNVE